MKVSRNNLKVLIVFLGLLAGNALANSHCAKNSSKPKMKMYFSSSQNKYFVPATLPLSMNIFGKESNKLPLVSSEDQSKSFLLPEGEYSIEIPSVVPMKYMIASDGTQPETGLKFLNAKTYIKSGTSYYGRSLELEFIPKDNLSGVEALFLSIDGSDFKKVKSNKFSFQENRKYELKYFALDYVGNCEELHEKTFYIDTLAPTSYLRINGKVPTKYQNIRGGFIELTSKDNMVGVKNIKYSFDKEKWYNFYQGIALSTLTPGEKTIYYYGIDNLDQAEPVQSYSFYFDNDLPEVSINFQGDMHNKHNVFFVNQATKILIDAKDSHPNSTMVEYKLGHNSKKTFAGPIDISSLTGEHKLTVYATDGASNRIEKTYYIYIDVNHPEVDYTILPAPSKKGELFYLQTNSEMRAETRDGGVGVKTTQLCINDKCVQGLEKYTFSKPGTYKVYSKTEDLVGNKLKGEIREFVVESGKRVVEEVDFKGLDKKWVSDKEYGSIGPQHKKIYMIITDSEDLEASKNSFVLNLEIPKSFLSKQGENTFNMSFGKNDISVVIPVDETPPETEILWNQTKPFQKGDDLFFGPGLDLTFQASDKKNTPFAGADKTFVSIDGMEYSPISSKGVKLVKEKFYVVKYFSVDRIGNKEAPKTKKFHVDVSAPSTKLSLTKKCFENICPSVATINLNAVDGGSGVEKVLYSIDTTKKFIEAATNDIVVSLKNLKEGDHNLYYKTVDNVGNWEKIKTFNFKVDNSPPRITHKIIGKSCKQKKQVSAGKNSSIRLSAVDDLAGIQKIEWREGDKDWILYNEEISIPEENTHFDIEYKVTDKVNNSRVVRKIALVSDVVVPESKMKIQGKYHTFLDSLYIQPSSKIVLKGQDEGSEEVSIKYRINSGPLLNYNGPFSVKGFSEFDLSFFAIDCVQNQEKEHRYHVIVDTEAPQVQVEKEGNLLYLSFQDLHSGVKELYYSINGSDKKNYKRPIKIEKSVEAVVEVWAIDWIDNSSYVKSIFEVQ